MIALLGGSGFIGGAFAERMRTRGLRFVALSRAELDYCHPEVLQRWISETRPEFLINCAGYAGKPNVDACEQHKAECLMANSVLPGIIAQACRDEGITWGHVSSGCIFQGEGPDGRGFTEDDQPNFCFRSPPCSFYSGSKALGEEVICDLSNCYVWRVRMPFSNRNMS
jgi:dTDP-4-dehydrorhamnose reductase